MVNYDFEECEVIANNWMEALVVKNMVCPSLHNDVMRRSLEPISEIPWKIKIYRQFLKREDCTKKDILVARVHETENRDIIYWSNEELFTKWLDSLGLSE